MNNLATCACAHHQKPGTGGTFCWRVVVLLLLFIQTAQSMYAQDIKLPVVKPEGGKPFMQAVGERHSVREFDASKDVPVALLGELLWASVGVNRKDAVAPQPGKNAVNRCNPTALNSQEIRAFVFGKEGVWEYMPQEHMLEAVASGDHRSLVAGTRAFSQDFVVDAPYSVVFVADVEKLPEGPNRTVLAAFDAGIACENLTLACSAMGLATVPRATMDVKAISTLLSLQATQLPMLNNPVGYPR